MDNMMNKQDLIRKIQELSFYAVELNLFLDTHPDNVQALQDYDYVLQTLEQLKKVYSQNFGSLLNFGCASVNNNNFWTWVAPEEKWPWENK